MSNIFKTFGKDVVLPELFQIWKRRSRGNALYTHAVVIEIPWPMSLKGIKKSDQVVLRSYDNENKRIPHGAQSSRVTLENLLKNFVYTGEKVATKY